MRKQQTKQGQPSSRSQDSGKSADQQAQKNVHGEGNYAASKQYNDATRDFVKSGRVEKAAKDAAPASDADALQMQAAEAEGKRHARGEDPSLNRKRDVLTPDAARIPKPGETRGNLAAGARGVAQPLSARDREIGETIGTALAPEGLLLIGLDVIGDYLTEINVTRPTGIREIMEQSGCNVAALMIDALERHVRARG